MQAAVLVSGAPTPACTPAWRACWTAPRTSSRPPSRSAPSWAATCAWTRPWTSPLPPLPKVPFVALFMYCYYLLLRLVVGVVAHAEETAQHCHEPTTKFANNLLIIHHILMQERVLQRGPQETRAPWKAATMEMRTQTRAKATESAAELTPLMKIITIIAVSSRDTIRQVRGISCALYVIF